MYRTGTGVLAACLCLAAFGCGGGIEGGSSSGTIDPMTPEAKAYAEQAKGKMNMKKGPNRAGQGNTRKRSL
jgi:hypothetical protein